MAGSLICKVRGKRAGGRVAAIEDQRSFAVDALVETQTDLAAGHARDVAGIYAFGDKGFDEKGAEGILSHPGNQACIPAQADDGSGISGRSPAGVFLEVESTAHGFAYPPRHELHQRLA